jgi:hypothetical protein
MATAEDLRAFQLHLTATGVQPPTKENTPRHSKLPDTGSD